MQLLKLRCSALPRVLKCPGSARAPELAIDRENDAAVLGTEAHKWVAQYVSGDDIELSEIESKDLRILVALAIRMWNQLREYFPGAVAERTAVTRQFVDHGFSLSGTVDIVARGAGYTSVADWKTGRVDNDYWAQLMGYCVLFAEPGDRATGAILWVRDEEVENYTSDQDERDAFLQRITDEVVDWDGVYHPGSHCGFCPRYHECDARTAHDRASLRAFLREESTTDILADLPPETQLDLYEQAATVERLAAAVRKGLREIVAANGPIKTKSRMLQLVPNNRTTIEPLQAWPVLDQFGLDDEAKASVIRIAKGELEDVVAKAAPPRQGAAKIRELRAALEEAGALSVQVGQKLKFGRAR